jgi:hypothetical protein
MFPVLNGRKLQTVPLRTPFHLAFGVFLRETNLAVRGATSKQDKSLVSPDFTKCVEAENALAHFTGRWGGGCWIGTVRTPDSSEQRGHEQPP